MTKNDEKLSTFQEVMSRFRVSESTLRRWVRSGEIEVIKMGRHLRFPESEVKRFLDLRRRARNRQQKHASS